jgi:DNA repair exonuclease SbcCD ATPase subunit
LSRESELLLENKTLANNFATITVEKNRMQREIEGLRRQVGDLKLELEKYAQERNSLLLEMKQAQQTSTLLTTHIDKLKNDKKKLRNKLKQTRDEA